MAPQRYHIQAHYLGKSLPLAEIEKKNELSLVTKRRNSLTFQPAHDQTMTVFSYGVVVFFNFEDKLKSKFVKQMARYAVDPLDKPNTEEYEVVADTERKPSVEFNEVVIGKIEPEAIHLISEVLAQSAAIDFVDERVDRFFARFEQINTSLENTGKIPVSDLAVRKTIGAGRNIVQYVITKLALLDKPDIIWDSKEHETLFVGMRKMFELEERFKNLEYRTNFIQDTSEIVLDILATRRSHALEWGIIALFIIDLVLVLYEIIRK